MPEIGIETLPPAEELQVLRLELAKSQREVSRLIDDLANIRRHGLTVAEMTCDSGARAAGQALADLCHDAMNQEEPMQEADREVTSTVSRSGSSSSDTLPRRMAP